LWLRRFVAECARRRLPLVLFVPPAPSFVEAERARSGYDAGFRAYVESLWRDNPGLSLDTVTFSGYAVDDFSDDHHFSRKGRIRLSDDFATWLAARYVGDKAR
jgi:hypothetical protein